MTFYETLTLVMKEKGMTAAALAEKTGLYPSFFSKLKSGHTKSVNLKTLSNAVKRLLRPFPT